ncbi:hypothetical protein J4573_51730 [Actinomadura barringtoniae]|uniref:Uncharacterized protein n=1 Tax=Actinomadura barringtoniae TaxID=1427535 RepID=A0A939PNJ9_9ACTN|nr:hypothetical protein [Actinomadura barringtoniae]MBO2455627.1 hypothetical protein [Actinomadura barringtoniae]
MTIDTPTEGHDTTAPGDGPTVALPRHAQPAHGRHTAPVFVDGTGRRARRVRVLGIIAGLSLAAYLSVVGVNLVAGADVPFTPWPTGKHGGHGSTKPDSGSPARAGSATGGPRGARPGTTATPGGDASQPGPTSAPSRVPGAGPTPQPSAAPTSAAPTTAAPTPTVTPTHPGNGNATKTPPGWSKKKPKA